MIQVSHPNQHKLTLTMILPRFLLLIFCLYRHILLAWAQELFLAEMLDHAPNHLLVRLKDWLDFAPIEAACASYRHQKGPGRKPEYSISILARAILVGWLYGLSLRQLEARLYSDLAARWFVGCQAGEPIPDHTTLNRFELWLLYHHPDLYFTTVVRQIDQAFPSERQKIQIGDTYAMLAYAAEEGLVGRIRHVCLRLMLELQDALSKGFETGLQGFDWCALFGVYPEKSLALLSKLEREARLERTALAALDFAQRVDRLLSAHSRQEHRLLRSWRAYLGKILADELKIERDEQGQPVRVGELPYKDKGDFRLISATDPEATYRMHGENDAQVSFGYNIQVAATPSGLIRETQAYTGADPDQAGVAALISAQIERLGTCPPKLIYDKAAGSGKTRAEVEQASGGQTLLVAKAMPYDQRSPRFGPYDFSLSEDGQALTCPNGIVSTTAYRSASGDGCNFRYFADQCWNADPPKQMKAATPEQLACRCPLWEQCRDSRQGPGAMRQVFISDYRPQVLAAAAYNQTENFKKEMKQRPLIERVIFELTNYCSARHCRRRGLLAADFQAKMCATVYNLKWWVRKLSRNAPRQAAAQAG